MFGLLVLFLSLFIDISYECLPGIYCNNILSEYRMENMDCETNGIIIDSTSTLGDLINDDPNTKCIGDEDIGIKTNYDSTFSQSLSHLKFPLDTITFSLWFKGIDTSSSVIQISNSVNNIPLLSLRLKKVIYFNDQLNKYDSVIFKNITFFQYNNEVIIISNNTVKVYVNSELAFKNKINLSLQLFNSSSIIDFFTTNNMMFYYFSIYNEVLSEENIKNNYKVGFQPSFPNYYSQNPIITSENNEIDINIYYLWADEYYTKPMIDDIVKYFKIEIIPPNLGIFKVNNTIIVSPLNILIENLKLSYNPPQDTFNETAPLTYFKINIEYDGIYKSQIFNITVLPHVYPPISVNSTQSLEYLKNENIHFPTPILHPLSKDIRFVIEDLPSYGNLTLNNIEDIDYFNFTDIDNIIYKSINNQNRCQRNEMYFEDSISYYIDDKTNNIISYLYIIKFFISCYSPCKLVINTTYENQNMTINLDCPKTHTTRIVIFSPPKHGDYYYIVNNTIVNRYPIDYYDNTIYYSPRYKYFNYPTQNINNKTIINKEDEESLTYKYYVDENLIFFKSLKIDVINVIDNFTMYNYIYIYRISYPKEISFKLYETKKESIKINDFDNKYHSYKLLYQSKEILILFKYPKTCLLSITNNLDKTNDIIGNYTCVKDLLLNIYFGVTSPNNGIKLVIERDDNTTISLNFNYVFKNTINRVFSFSISVLSGLCVITVHFTSIIIVKLHTMIIKREKKRKMEEANKVSFVTIKL